MKTVLVLEDDPSNMQVFSTVLWSMGYRVLEATTGKEAVGTANAQDGLVDLLISDLAIPDLSGTEVALEVIKAHPAMPILFVSGTPVSAWDRRDRNNLSQLPRDRVEILEKPFRPAVFMYKVGELLERPARRAASWR